MITTFFSILGALGLFLYGMRVMSDGIQKVAGNRLQQILNSMTKNRLLAVTTGVIITGLVQSSSATTVMVVSFVNAALLNLTQAIGVIMGANIGTTVTTWIVSLIGFKFKITAIALPIIGIGLPFIFSKLKKRRDFGEVLIGFGLLFLGLMFLKGSVPDIRSHPEALEFLAQFTNLPSVLSMLFFVFVGTILTIIVQSSSAAMAITVTMAAFGWIDFPTAAAIVLGENIGTTITAYLASLGTSINARRAARAHLLFNVFGVIWMMLLFQLFTSENGLIYRLAPWNPLLTNGDGVLVNLPLNLSLFHTVFNITNTLICIGLIPFFAKLVTRLVKEKESDKLKEYKLQYISTGLQDTGMLNLFEVQNEIHKMANITNEMYDIFLNVFNNPKKKMGNFVEKSKELEELTDSMQIEISKYIMDCAKDGLNDQGISRSNILIRIVHELENIGDSCYRLMKLTQKKYDKNINFQQVATKEMNDYSLLVSEFINYYSEFLGNKINNEDIDIELAYKFESKINDSRDTLRKTAQKRLQEGANVESELLYIDFVKHFEHIGDNSLNIIQGLKQIQ
jgi:phosphate:Na+ symporter